MKLVFWSDRPGHGHVTTSMLALMGIAASRFNYKCAVLQLSHLWSNGLQQAFLDMSLVNGDYFQDNGIDALLRTVKTGVSDNQQIINCGFSFMNRNVSMYVPTKSEIPENYYNELLELETPLLNALDASHELVFIDAGSGNTPIAIKALEEADVIVICLPQNINGIRDFIRNYKIEANNIYFVCGNYDKGSSMSMPVFRKRFKSDIFPKNSGIIPHDINFTDALAIGEISRFFLSNKRTSVKDPSHAFVNECKKTFISIMKHIGYNLKDEEE